MYRIEFPEPIHHRDFVASLGRAILASRERRIRGRNPAVQYLPDRPGITRESDTWYLLKCAGRFMDVMAGVLVAEGYLVRITEVENPWEMKKPALPEDRPLPVPDQLPDQAAGGDI